MAGSCKAAVSQTADLCACAQSPGIEFQYAFQPIVDVDKGAIFAQEALVRGPNGEGAGSVLS